MVVVPEAGVNGSALVQPHHLLDGGIGTHGTLEVHVAALANRIPRNVRPVRYAQLRGVCVGSKTKINK